MSEENKAPVKPGEKPCQTPTPPQAPKTPRIEIGEHRSYDIPTSEANPAMPPVKPPKED